jgi:excisionase family DNA binding protein
VPTRTPCVLEKTPTAPVVEPRAMNIQAAATYIGANVWFLRNLIWNRKIPFLKLGNRYVFDKKDLDRYVENNKVEVVRG